MNDQERHHILVKKNYDLIIITKIRSTLLALLPANTFGIYDIQSLKKTGELKPDIETATTFYDLAVTKRGLFTPLIRAFERDSQHAVALILNELPENQRQQMTSNDQVNHMPEEPQASANQPHASHQNLTTPNQSTQKIDAAGNMKKLAETFGITEDELRKLLDFVNDTSPLDVVIELPENKIDDKDCQYLIPPGSKGLALILNIIEFKNLQNRPREKGGSLDTKYMFHLWNQLGYKIYPVSEKDRENPLKFKDDIMRMIKDFKDACKRQKPSSVVVFIGSHGGHDRICTSDPADANNKLVTLKLYQDIIEQFSTKNCPILENKPKIFLVQTCQDHFREETDATPFLHISDTIVCTAQVPGSDAVRDPFKGSWFPYCLTWVFMKKAHQCTLREMLDMVKEMIVNIESESSTGQMVAINDIGMRSKLRFYFDDPA